jgi:hypothetical protein
MPEQRRATVFRSVIWGLAAVGVLASAPVGWCQDRKDADAIKQDVAALQGRWERVMTTETSALGKAKRAVKVFKGDQETVTWYDDKGGVLRSHRVTFKLSEMGNVRIYSFSDMQVLDADGREQGPLIKASNSTIYRVDGDRLVEAGGFIQGDAFRRSTPYFAEWKRVAER